MFKCDVNDLAYEVIDSSVDEALAGQAKQIDVILFGDGSLQVADDGCGMPVDIGPQEQVSGVERILTRLDSAAVPRRLGVGVVNALSRRLACRTCRADRQHHISFRDGLVDTPLTVIRDLPEKAATATTMRFWPEPALFDTVKFEAALLKHVLKARAALCPGLRVTFTHEATGETNQWCFAGGLGAYLLDELYGQTYLPAPPVTADEDGGAVSFALCWAQRVFSESYVNLYLTLGGGTHVKGLRAGVAAALRQFCELRNLGPGGLTLAAEDVRDQASYVLSVRINQPSFSGATQDCLCSREAEALVEGVAAGSMARWLSRHPDAGARIAGLAMRKSARFEIPTTH